MTTATARARRAIRVPGVEAFTLRFTTFAIGLGGFVFGGLAIGPWSEQSPPGQELRSALAFIVIMIWPIINAGLATRLSSEWIRLLNAGYAFAYLVSLVAYLLIGETGVEDYGRHWLVSVLALPAVAAMAARPGWLGWAYLAVESVLATAAVYRASLSPDRLIESLQNGLYGFAYSSFFVGFAFVGLMASARLDARLAAEARAQAEAAARTAGERERQRLESLVHDSVISTLLMAGRGTAAPAELAEQAGRALNALGAERSRGIASIAEVRTRLRGLVAEAGPRVSSSADVSGELEVPLEVVDALEGAAAEALRNAQQHAGAITAHGEPVRIGVEFGADAEGLRLCIVDDGRGFDPDRVSGERMGISGSIVARMLAVGGSAEIVSAPRAGTRVTLDWRRP